MQTQHRPTSTPPPGYAPNERPSDAVFSLLVNPGGWVTLCFLEGAHLPDPEKLLRGSGNRVRHIRLKGPDDLDLAAVRALVTAAMEEAEPQFDPRARRKLIIRAVAAKQRPRKGKGQRAKGKGEGKEERAKGIQRQRSG